MEDEMSEEIRQLDAGDVAAFRALRLAALARHPEAFAASFDEEEALPVGATAERLAHSAVFGVRVGDRLMAVAGFARPEPLKKRHKGVLWGVYVDEAVRRRGLGRVVVERVIDHARAQVAQLHAAVVTGNEPARRLYRALGFRPYGIEPRGLRVGERYLDQELLMRVLDGGD
jgi:RimJ/RimL family protein N-acetyltransferase